MVMVSVSEAERQLNLSHGQIRYWLKTGRITAAAYQAGSTASRSLIDLDAVSRAKDSSYTPRGPLETRPIVTLASNGHQQVIAPAQTLDQHAPLDQQAGPPLPLGYIRTAVLAEQFLAQRKLAVERGSLSPETHRQDRYHLARWVANTPGFPWNQSDVDTFDAKLGTRRFRWHCMRYVRQFSHWAAKRYPNAHLPEIKVGMLKPRRPDVLTPEQEIATLQQIKAHSLDLYIYSVAMIRTGCRPWELLEADWETTSPTGFVTAGRAKKKAGPVYFPPGLWELLQTLPEPHTGALFKQQLSGGTQLRYAPGSRATSQQMRSRFQRALGTYVGVGSYRFRHLYIERMKDHMTLERLATVTRTSVKMLEEVYGKHADASNLAEVTRAAAEVWGAVA